VAVRVSTGSLVQVCSSSRDVVTATTSKQPLVPLAHVGSVEYTYGESTACRTAS
jgi:hypothetical protein